MRKCKARKRADRGVQKEIRRKEHNEREKKKRERDPKYQTKFKNKRRSQSKHHIHTENSSHHVIQLSTNPDGTVTNSNFDIN
jgi:hypothetical protein